MFRRCAASVKLAEVMSAADRSMTTDRREAMMEANSKIVLLDWGTELWQAPLHGQLGAVAVPNGGVAARAESRYAVV